MVTHTHKSSFVKNLWENSSVYNEICRGIHTNRSGITFPLVVTICTFPLHTLIKVTSQKVANAEVEIIAINILKPKQGILH